MMPLSISTVNRYSPYTITSPYGLSV